MSFSNENILLVVILLMSILLFYQQMTLRESADAYASIMCNRLIEMFRLPSPVERTIPTQIINMTIPSSTP